MSSPQPNESTMHKTTLAILASYEHQDLDEIISFRNPDCKHVIYPTSLARPIYSNTEYRTFFAATIPRIWNFKLTITEILEDVAKNKTIVLASSTADSKAGVGSYAQEYVLVFEFDESGEKINKMIEWVDSTKARENVAILFG